MSEKQTREPEIFAAGDTLEFYRDLQDYLPGDGWSLTYVLTDLTGTEKDSITSTTDENRHKIYKQAFGSGMDAGDYILTGTAVNSTSNDRKRIYQMVLTLDPDYQAGAASEQVVKTEAQQMLEILSDSLKNLYKQVFQETDVQRSKFVLQKQSEVLQQMQYWKEVRNNEIQWERARNGRSLNTGIIFAIGA